MNTLTALITGIFVAPNFSFIEIIIKIVSEVSVSAWETFQDKNLLGIY